MIKDILPGKYAEADTTDFTFINKEKFYYDECINNEELIHIFLNNPIILSHSYTYMNGNNKNTYYGYQNIDFVIDALKDLSKNKNKRLDKLKDFKFF